MTEDRITRLYRQIFEDLQALGPKRFRDFQEETSKWVQDLLSDTFDPARMTDFLRSMRIDMSQFGQLFGRMAQTGAMPQGFDPYRILGLEKSATDEEVKERYRERVRQFHPDTAGPGMEFHFQCTLAAYEMIKRERGWQ